MGCGCATVNAVVAQNRKRYKVKDAQAHWETANKPSVLCATVAIDRDTASSHFGHVAHPVCNPCHGWIDGFVKSEARLKQERANAGSTSRLDRMRQKKLVTYHNK